MADDKPWQFKPGNPGGPGRPKGPTLRTLMKRRLREAGACADTLADEFIEQLIEEARTGKTPLLDVFKWLEGSNPPQKQAASQGGIVVEHRDDDPAEEAAPGAADGQRPA